MQQIALSSSAELRATTVVTLRTATSNGAITVCTLNDSCRQWCIELELGAEDRPVLAVTGHDVDVVGALLPPAVPEDPAAAAASVDGDSDDDSEEGGEEMEVDESGEEAGEEDEDEDIDEDEDEDEGESEDESDKVDQESEEGGEGESESEEDEEDGDSEESEEADAADTADAVAEVDEVDESESDEGESDEGESDEGKDESDEEDGLSAPVVAAAPATAVVHSRVEAAPSEAEGGAEGDLVDMDVSCRDCRADFVFTVQEQRFFLEHGYKIPRVRCKQCSEAKKLGNYDKSGQGATPGKGKGDGDKGKGKGKGKGKEYSGFAPDSGGKGKGKGKDSGKGKGGSATDTRPCYNCGEVGHMSWTCSKPRSGKGKGASGGKGAGGKGGGGW